LELLRSLRNHPESFVNARSPLFWVAWFSTTEEFRAINAGRLEGKWSDPEGNWTWEWKFTP
jgi:hypothetical protein